MKKVYVVIAILLMTSAYVSAADYWHFGVGARLAGVIPGKNYGDALGGGLMLTFGDPDSRFTTQLEVDTWARTYNMDDSLVLVTFPPNPDSSYKKRDYHYSGLSVGFFEKIRTVDFTSGFSNYITGGLGGYFLGRKREDKLQLGGTQVKSLGFHSVVMLAAGTGFEARINDHLASFVEGRYVFIVSGDKADKNLALGYVGIRYIF
jgi:hypothetical protein